MADRRQRTPEEREAARLERERKRALRRGETPPPEPAPAPEPEPAASIRDPEPDTEPEPVPVPERVPEPEPERVPEPERERVPEPEREPVTASASASRSAAPASLPAPVPPQPVPAPVPVPSTRSEPEIESDASDDLRAGENEDGTGEHELETGEHQLETPSGTRRVSVLDKPPVAPPPRKPTKRKPLQRKSRGGPGEGRRRHSWLLRIASLIALALAAGVIWFLIEAFQPFGASPHGRVTVTIPPHASSSQIADMLQHNGVISSSFFFGVRATLDGDRSDMRSGVYHFQLGMSYGDVLNALTKAPPAAKVTELTITEGRRRKQIDQLLRAQGVKGSYLVASRSSPLIDPRAYGMRHKPRTLEGFLFPDTYQLVEPIRVQTLVDDQLREFKKQFAKVNLSYARRHHLTPYDVLIIASLIEGETPTAHDRPLVSSVIYNRLANGMLLQLDSTTQYATGNFTRPLTVSQLHSRSPYNTRTHPGLPPTPINSPGLASLQAAAHPAQTKYLFFFGKPCQRGSVFASNYSQFLNLEAKYQKKHC